MHTWGKHLRHAFQRPAAKPENRSAFLPFHLLLLTTYCLRRKVQDTSGTELVNLIAFFVQVLLTFRLSPLTPKYFDVKMLSRHACLHPSVAFHYIVFSQFYQHKYNYGT